MDKLYHTLAFIGVHILFLIVEAGLLLSIYVAAVDKDRSVLIITGLLLAAKNCLKGIWETVKIDYTIDKKEENYEYDGRYFVQKRLRGRAKSGTDSCFFDRNREN